MDEPRKHVIWKKASYMVKIVNFSTIKNKPPKGKIKKGKESCSGLVDIKKTWQLDAIYDCVLHPGLGEIAIKEIIWESWLNLKVDYGLDNSMY